MDQEYITKMAEEYNVPQHIVGPIVRYLIDRCEPGSFLRAVFENDLKGAVGRADHINERSLKQIVSFMYNVMPANSQGSPEAVAAWLKGAS